MPLEFIARKNSKTLIILVHGLTGNSKTFTNSEGVPFVECLSRQVQSACDFAAYLYPSSLLDKIPDYVYLLPGAKKLLGSRNQDLIKHASVLKTYCYTNSSYSKIGFICHSMGGLIAKRTIVEITKERGSFSGFYISLATPHRGVEAAANLAALNRHLDALRPHSEIVQSTVNDWPAISSKIGCCYFSAINDEVVTEISACPPGGEPHHIRVEGTHTTICKPATPDCLVAANVSRKIAGFIGLAQEYPPATKTERDPLFLYFRPGYEDLYLVRSIDRQLVPVLESRHAWVFGPSGCGKTNVVQYLAAKQNGTVLYVDVSAAERRTSDLLTSILDTLERESERRGISCSEKDTMNLVQGIQEAVCRISQNEPVTLIVDEIGVIDGDDFSNLARSMVAISRAAAKQAASFRLVLCTGASPTAHLGRSDSDLLKEHFEMSEMSLWSAEEILSLCELLQREFKCALSKTDQSEVLSFASRSPRRLKYLFKQALARMHSFPGTSIEEGLRFALIRETLT